MVATKDSEGQQAANLVVDQHAVPGEFKPAKKHKKASTDLDDAHQQPQQPEAAAEVGQADAEYEKAEQKHKMKSKKKLLSEEKLRRLKEQHDKRGIIYLSRLPPHMKPGKLRQLLSQYGEIGRIYCTPEDQALRQQRKKKGGNSGKNFTEGWVEFEDKAVAKSVAASLNGQQIGGKRRSAYHFDLWTMKYLPKFKWDHLTEEINYEKAVREQRMAQELAAAKRERDFYLSRVDRAKAQAAMEERRKKKQQQQQQQGVEQAAAAAGELQQDRQPEAAATAAGAKRVYGQRQAKPDPTKEGAVEIGDDVLNLIVAKKQRVL